MKIKDFIKVYLYCLLVSFCFLMIATQTSFLYAVNNWVDTNIYFTMGKSMFNGIIPFKDIFEQKGPLLYLIYGIGYLISSTSYIGVFILEVVSFSIALFYIYKIISLYTSKKYYYALLPIFSYVLFTSNCFFDGGGSAEEFTLPLLFISLYYVIKYLKDNIIKNRTMLIIGLMIGNVFLIKYTILGFYIGFVILLMHKKIRSKEYKDLIVKLLYCALGFVVSILPWIIYFIVNNGLIDFLKVYILDNITGYGNQYSNLLSKFGYILGMSCFIMFANFIMSLLIVMSFINICRKNSRFALEYLFLVIISLMFIFIGSCQYYYFIPISIFSVIGLLNLIIFFDNKININKKVIVFLVFVISLTLTCLLNSNTKYIKLKKEDLPQFIFADIINKIPDSTILNYGSLDFGFYFASNKIPVTRYFHNGNYDYQYYPYNQDAMKEYMENKKTDFVIEIIDPRTYTWVESFYNVSKNYTIVCSKSMDYKGRNYTFHLYSLPEIKEKLTIQDTMKCDNIY